MSVVQKTRFAFFGLFLFLFRLAAPPCVPNPQANTKGVKYQPAPVWLRQARVVLDPSGFLGGAASLNKDISAAPRTAAALEARSLSQNAEKA